MGLPLRLRISWNMNAHGWSKLEHLTYPLSIQFRHQQYHFSMRNLLCFFELTEVTPFDFSQIDILRFH